VNEEDAMTTTGSVNGNHMAIPTDVSGLRHDITRTREELGETIEALAAKADVKARAQESVDELKQRALAKVQDTRAGVRDGFTAIRADPVGQAKLGLDWVRASVRQRPAPWIVAAAFVALAALVSAGKRGRR
jgi:hypothetical protein